MKRISGLLIVAIVASSVTGCGCCRRVRDTLCRGAYCGPPAAAALAPAPVPAIAAPMAAPIAAAPACGCEFTAPVAYDAGCGCPSEFQTTAFGGAVCDGCQGGSYTLPGTAGGVIYDDPGFVTTPGPTMSTDPGPAPTN